jgi:hypothetical protein
MGRTCSTCERWEKHTKFLSENLRGGDCFEDVNVDGKTILELILQKWKWQGVWARYIGLRIGLVVGSCECGNESLVSIKGREFLEWVTISFSVTASWSSFTLSFSTYINFGHMKVFFASTKELPRLSPFLFHNWGKHYLIWYFRLYKKHPFV